MGSVSVLDDFWLDDETYNRLQNNSIVCITAYDRRTIRQMLVNGSFFHNEFGIRAGLYNRSCLPTHMIKAGISSMLMVNSAIVLAVLICEPLIESILPNSH